MLKNCRPVRRVAAVVLLVAFTLTAIGQQTQQSTPAPASTPTAATEPTPAQTHQMMKVMKSLSRYEEGTKLDIQLTDGSHQIGKVGETRSTNFVFVDSVDGKARTIDYLDVEGVKPTGRGTMARQLQRSMTGKPGLVIGSVVVLAVIGVIAILALHK